MDFEDILISEDVTIMEALKILDETGKGGILFVERMGKLVGAVSDGDIRRWLLKAGDMGAAVSAICNYHPKYVKQSQRGQARELLLKYHLQAVPVVNDDLNILDVIYIYEDQTVQCEKINLPVVVMAGGQGTRLYPYTKILPKPLIPIGEIPISEHILNIFHDKGCNDFYLIVNYKKNMIKAYFNEIEKKYTITYIDEEKPLGTGGGVGLLKGKINSTFILTNCDSIIEEDFSKILATHHEKKNLVTMICALRTYEVPYGVVEIGKNGFIKRMQEKPSMTYFTNTGTYIVEPEVINMIESGKAIDFPNIVQHLIDTGKNVGVYPIGKSAWLDMGQFDTMEEMKERLHIID